MPKKTGERNQRIFEFARKLKANDDLAKLNPQNFSQVVRQWHKQALPNINTKEFSETWLDFLTAWDNIIFTGDRNIMDFYQSTLNLEPPRIVKELHSDSSELLRLSAFCRELQKASGESPFFLACRTAAKLLNVSPMQASRYLKLLVLEGILEIDKKGGNKDNKASRYRYIYEDIDN